MQRRIAVIEKEKCNPVGCGGYLCIRKSPGNRMGREVFYIGEDGKAAVNEDVATDAESITVKVCPYGAIHMVKLPEKLTEQPIHRYGKDGFILYQLPTPLFGNVMGVMGVNGVGKSTALKVLARILEPNLGGKENASFTDLVEYFRGSQAHLFFEKLSRNEITLSYKPQAVDLIPKQVQGKVRDLLEKTDEKGSLKEVVKQLNIDHILDNNVQELSGGELQRVAIAAAALKKANVYFFDEPTSFLDIHQRIVVSKFIRSLASEQVAVMVVEHDLVILDYMADFIHIMYGESGAYGIVSQSKPTRNAINTYLSGYLREENMRFRNYEIKFAERPPEKILKSEALVSWKGVEKKLGKFTLKAADGSIPRKRVIGVLGPNGIGKTSFIKMLAGVDKPDRGDISASITVSYKPQYISNDSSELVESVAQNCDEHLRKQLNLDPLRSKELRQLSGGELQRVAIASCLSKDADLYLLDEPSAYLDVEQRLAISKIIRERMDLSGKTALIVDHDLIFIDYVSESLIVFSGEPGVSGAASNTLSMEEGMNSFLRNLNVTLRRDPDSKRPRINKPDSRLDREQRSSGNLYYGSS